MTKVNDERNPKPELKASAFRLSAFFGPFLQCPRESLHSEFDQVGIGTKEKVVRVELPFCETGFKIGVANQHSKDKPQRRGEQSWTQIAQMIADL